MSSLLFLGVVHLICYLYKLLLLPMSAHECLLLVSPHSVLLPLSAREVFHYSTFRLSHHCTEFVTPYQLFTIRPVSKPVMSYTYLDSSAEIVYTSKSYHCRFGVSLRTPCNAFQFCVFSHRIYIYIKTHFLPRPTSPEGRMDIVQSEAIP